jgi:general secretion pathway protein C
MNTLADKLKSLDPAILQRYQTWLSPALIALLLMACAWSLSQLTWLLVPQAEQDAPPPAIPRATQARPATLNVQQLADAHIFGQFQIKATAASTANAPETSMNLVLKGVLAGGKNIAFAIIAQGKNGPEDFYSLGDQISGAILREVHADKVILERNGRFETLTLPEEYSDNALIAQDMGDGGGEVASASTPGEAVANMRQKILRNPTSFGEFAIPIPFNENGKLRGYKLQPQGDRTLYDQVGLNPDDVIIEINGVELNDPTKGIKALRNLQRAKSIDAKVLRGGTEVPIHIEIP